MSRNGTGNNLSTAISTSPNSPRAILILLHGSIGDVTRALPLVNLLRRRFPLAKLAWSVEPPSLPLVEHCDGIDEVIVFDRRRWWKDLVPFLRTIRSHRFDLVLDLQRHLKSGLISRWTGAPYRLGFHPADAKECNWLFNNQFISAAGDEIPKIDHYMKFAEHLGIVPQPLEWKISITPQDALAVESYLRRMDGEFAVLFAGARWESKRWFPDQIAACAREIQKRHGLHVVLLGAREDQTVARAAEVASTGQFYNWVGRTTLREAAAIISRARVCVGPDTGLMHVAAAVGTPVVSLWGATDPLRTGPYGYDDLVVKGYAECSPCYRARCAIGRICMRSIDIDEILEKVSRALSRGQLTAAASGERQ